MAKFLFYVQLKQNTVTHKAVVSVYASNKAAQSLISASVQYRLEMLNLHVGFYLRHHCDDWLMEAMTSEKPRAKNGENFKRSCCCRTRRMNSAAI